MAGWESRLGKVKGQERILIGDRLNALDEIRQHASMRAVFDDTGLSDNILELNKGKRKFNNLQLLKSRDFENNLLLFIATNNSTENFAYKLAKTEIEKIIQLLENEIQ